MTPGTTTMPGISPITGTVTTPENPAAAENPADTGAPAIPELPPIPEIPTRACEPEIPPTIDINNPLFKVILPDPCKELNEGCIIVRTYVGEKTIPLEGTAVAVYKAGVRKKELVSLQTTDETGSTPIIMVEAAEKHLSELPGISAPHDHYFVNAWAPHYYPVVDRAVDVFSGAASVLDIQMEPLSEEKPGMPMGVKTGG